MSGDLHNHPNGYCYLLVPLYQLTLLLNRTTPGALFGYVIENHSGIPSWTVYLPSVKSHYSVFGGGDSIHTELFGVY